MTPDKIILMIIEQAGGKIRGKTLLQKEAYFLSKVLNLDLGYHAHYYGPYSPEIEMGIGRLKSLGFIAETTLGFGTTNQQGFEVRRYDYEITDDGKIILQRLRLQDAMKCKQIEKALSLIREAGDVGDYLSLSIAAKTYYVLDAQGKPMNNEEIKHVATSLGWDISSESIDKAVNFLEKMKLVTSAS